MNETMVTVVGYIGTEPIEREVGSASVASFRVASTPRTFSVRDGVWADRETNWYTVNAWRILGKHCLSSLHRGDPVIVHGKLRTQIWKDESGVSRTAMTIEADAIGHDLARGTSAFLKDVRGVETSPEEADLAAQNAELEADAPTMTSEGRFLAEREPVGV